jgi:glycosyltransferase involved in cell wall biosynthesis
MYWGMPVVVLNRIHAPEIIYLKQGENGFIVNSEDELKSKILEICNNEDLHSRMSAAARHTYETEMQIENMFQGFIDAIRFVGK